MEIVENMGDLAANSSESTDYHFGFWIQNVVHLNTALVTKKMRIRSLRCNLTQADRDRHVSTHLRFGDLHYVTMGTRFLSIGDIHIGSSSHQGREVLQEGPASIDHLTPAIPRLLLLLSLTKLARRNQAENLAEDDGIL